MSAVGKHSQPYPWEQRKSKELFINISDKHHPELPVLSATQDNGMVYRQDLDIDIKYDEESLDNYKKVSPSDFVISLRSFQGGFEMSDKLGITSPAYTIFNFKSPNNQNPVFWKFLFKRYDFIESLKRVTFGIRDGKAISFKQFGDTKPSFPQLKEQQLIADILSKLDKTITLHEEQHRQLEQLKKALLQKMFADETGYPALRFKGFTEKWEQRKLGETVVNIVAGGDINKAELLSKGKYPVYANALTNNGIVGYYASQYRIAAPAVTVTGRGDIGIAKARDINFTPVVRLLAISSQHNNYFLENLINTHRSFAESTGVPQITVPQLSNYKLYFPQKINEEVFIGKLFKKMDHLTTLHQHKIDNLKRLKRALLQKMFV